MVLESVVADLLNRFLGDYVENLNKSQLKLGIWGGKRGGASELDVPFKVKAGQIDKLTLKIPWKNLYGEAVVATLEGLYLLVVPGASIKYDAEKEEKSLQDIKQKELSRIEEALQKAAEKGIVKAKKDTFLEKLATQVIKNIQVKITDIHIKYEDDVSNFSLLYKLTANKQWTPCILNEAEKIIYKPISASAKLYMNPYAETELKTPKLDWNIEVQNIAIELTKPQYLSMIDLLESVDYMVRNAPYRKYKPYLPLHTNGRQWWKYAIDSVLEVHIRRYTQMWSWSNIKKHRQLLKSYKNAYKNKLTQTKISEEIQKQIQVYLAYIGIDLLKYCLFFVAIDDLMTPEEKDKLFTAIGYSESTHDLTLPKQYVAHIMTLKLVSTSVTIRENKNIPEILKIQIIGLGTQVSQRPGAQALKVEAKLEHWYITGLRQQDIVPSLVASIGDTASSLLKIEFETNPENSTADQTLIVQSQPVEVIYDAKTINAVVEFFQSDKGLDLEQIKSATLMKLEEIKERTATGLTHIIETRKVLDLRINLKPSYLIVPQTGFHHKKSNLLILDFGTFQLNSKDQGLQKTSNSSLEEIMDKAYDKFDVEIKSVQLLFARAEENWKKCRFQHPSTMHILQPMDIHVELSKAMVEKDIRMARFKVSGGLPLMHVRISDKKMRDVLCLINSIPLPQISSAPSPERQVNEYNKMLNLCTFVCIVSSFSSFFELEYDSNYLSTFHWLTFDLTAVSYLKKISLDYHEIQGNRSKKKPLHLISSSDKPGLDLLKVEYIKVRNPTVIECFVLFVVIVSSKDSDIIDFRLFAKLNAFCVIICDEKNNIAEIKIQGLDSSLSLQSRKQSLFARLENIVVTDIDPNTVHKKAVSIMGNEVFRFNLDLYPHATEGDAYTDMSKVDGVVSLNVGCIQIVYLHKFLMSLLNFLNNFQTAKEALSAATAQAAEKAATSVKDLAQRSFRVSINIDLKAPVIVIPQSSISTNAVVVDLGLIRVQNQFSLVSGEDYLNPPVIDRMDVQLTKLKLSRTVIQPGISQPDIQLLYPINLEFSVNRNLASSWYHKVPVVEIKGHLESMNVSFYYILVSSSTSQDDVFDLKIIAELNAFNVFVCDQKCNIADIRIHGMDASISVKPKQTDMFARLKDIIVTNVDLLSIHKKAVSILGDEVFRFQMTLFPDATEGKAYADMSKVDGKLSLKVGCIQIVYVHKFFMSLLNFLNNFQTAKEALSAATVQAAERAASSMKDLAQKSFRLLMDINLKAPVIIIPQSSVSPNAVIADLGLIRVENKFSLVSVGHYSFPPVIDKMNIQLTQLKLSRYKYIIQLFNMLLSIQRNLAATWYTQIPGMEIKGKLKPMQAFIIDHSTVLVYIRSDDAFLIFIFMLEPSAQEDLPDSELSVDHNVTLQFDFHFESLSIVLYNNDESKLAFHNDNFRLGELRLHLMASAGKMFKDGSMNVSIKLKTCTLDDLREGIERATSRMIDRKNDQDNNSSMIDISYKQGKNGSHIDAVLDKLYICASVEFLMTVADFFIKAVSQSPENMAKEAQIPLRQTATAKLRIDKDDSLKPNMTLKAMITDPEVVFVASLTKADAPALTASFQCDLSLSTSKLEQMMEASVRDLKVLACPFLREKRGKNITTVLQPCSLFMEKCTWASGKQNINIIVEEFIIKISPIILNTVMTIMAALSPKTKEDESKDTSKETENLWGVKSISDYNSWFLGVDTATEITENFKDIDRPFIEENCAVVVESVQVTLECGLGHRTVPLLLAESKFSGNIKNWTSLMSAAADMTLEVHYYNEVHAVWEPLIERVEGKKQWNLRLDVKKNPVQDKSLMPGDDFGFIPEPQTAVHISSGDTMNITISKSCLNVFNNLGFSEGTASTFDYSLKDRAPFTVKNALGVPVKVQPNHNLRVMGSPEKSGIYDVDAGQNLELEYASVEPSRQGKLSILNRQESSFFTLTIVPHGYTEVGKIPVARPGRQLYNVRNPNATHSDSVLVQIDATEGNKVITIRSPLQIKNHFSVAFIIYKFVKNVKLLERIGVARPEEEFHVPLDSYRCQLFIQPAGILENQYKESTTYISWKEELHRSREVRCMLQCPSVEINFLPLMVNTVALPDELTYISTHGEDWDPAYIIHLYPTLTLRNLLPYSLRYLLEGAAETHELAEGSAADVLHSRISGEIMELVLMKYQGKNWNGHFRICDTLPEFFLVCFSSDSTEVMTLDLSVHVRRIGSRMVLSVFSPYWLINKTSRVLQYRSEDIHVKHPADLRDIILFSFKKKNIFSKNKVQLKISTSAWSSSFSLDTVGSYGCVKCPANNMEYLVGVSIKMSSFNLTRIVTLTPFCTIANKSSLELEVGEIASDGSMPTNKWNYIASSECLPFWPENLSGKLCVRVVGCEGSSKPFFYNRQDNGTLLSLEDLNGGILVDVNTAEHSTVITFSDYHEGSAPALIMNHTPCGILTYKQSGSQEEVELQPRQARLFAWADPTGTRKLTWKYAANVGEHDLLKDECGQFAYDANIQIHWVSFLDGRQRVLLFTDDVALVSKALQAEEMEQANHEITFSLHSLGLSLVNNENKQEVSYIGITSSGVIWEMKPKRKWKPFSQKQIILLEQSYKKYQESRGHGWIKLDNNFEVNFDKVPMEMRLPFQCPIKRDFLSGIQIEFKQSPHQRSLRARLYWLQVDNQLPGTMFPVLFHPVAPPKSIALDSEPKPFIDVSVITRFNEYSKVLQFKYFMVLIQEMALKVDQGFLGAITALFTPATDPEAESKRTKLIQQDVDALNTELMETSMTDMSSLSFFEHFHISPVKLHLSLSLSSGGEESDKEKQEMIAIHSVNLLLKSIGATLTDVDDLIFKLAYYEIKYQFYKRDQLMWSVFRHYTEQFLKQMYVLVLGLDVLGNPFGLIRGLSEGVEALFYEPFQGAVQGPEEFAEGLVIGVRSLFGHTVGGAAGVVSRITGSVGKGLAAITMDKEYQQKRREEMGRQPKDFGDSLARGGKGLLLGVVGGVTGIITKPVEGAKKEGAAGFFKGIGKGLVGAVARPTGGIIDMASSTFQGIQRAAESTEEVSSLRPPRLIHEDGIIRPYDRQESEGCDLFENHIKKLEGEIYRYHCAIPGNKKTILMVTNRRVLCIKEVEILGCMSIDWQCPFEDFVVPPSVSGNLLQILVKPVLVFTIHNNSFILQRACKAIEDAQSVRHQQKLVKQSSLKLLVP
uniref:Vacuolar protein sorting 13 homolog C n=1 Tax=Equus asinus asinus TaxID=83772 RepID=A0A8C4LBM7_EQUAS